MVGSDPQGWYADPFGQHEARYFSAGHPTKLVRDGSAESFDEPPSTAYRGPLRRADDTDETDSDTEPVQVAAAAAATRSRGRPRASVTMAVGLAAIGAIAAFVVFSKSVFPALARTPALSPVAFVNQSAQRTLTAGTADVTMYGTMPDGSRRDAVRGTGEANFGADSLAVHVSVRGSGGSMTEDEVQINQNLYFNISINSRSLSQFLAAVTGSRSRQTTQGRRI
jgi:hypothetical protein